MAHPGAAAPRADGGSLAYVYLLSGVAALGGLLFGYDTGVISGAIGFLKERFALDAVMEGWAVSSALVGCVGGALCAGVLSDAFGRRNILLLAAALFTVSAIGSALPRSLAEFAVARIIGGVGVGMASMLSPLYIAEISPAPVRGRMVSLNQFAIISGFLVVYFVNALIAWMGESGAGREWNVQWGWRAMMGSEVVPCALFLGMLLLVPESPRWLVKRGRAAEALRVLTRTVGAAAARAEVDAISEALAREEKPSLGALFAPGMRAALAVGVVLAVLQQVTGINVVLYYAPKIFESAGFGATAAIVQTVGVGAVNLGFTLVAIYIVDRVGRKPLLLAASAGMGLSLFALGTAFVTGSLGGPLVLLCVLAYVAFFAVAMGPVVWVVLSEIYPTRLRGTAMSVATLCLWCANFVVTQTFPRLLELFAGKSFFVYGVLCVVALVFIARFVPETKGRPLEEVEELWTTRRP